MTLRAVFRLAPLAIALFVIAGCGSVGDFFAHHDPNTDALNLGANPRPVAQPGANPSEKPKVLPVTAADINCPEVDIVDGGAALRVGGPENASVRYQFNISDRARECDPTGQQQVALKIGVAGEVVIGPAGSAGTYSAPLRITVTHQGDNQQVFSQVYRVEATTDGVTAGAFRVVTDPIMLPLTTLQLADVYSISIGFEGGNAAMTKPPKHRAQKTVG